MANDIPIHTRAARVSPPVVDNKGKVSSGGVIKNATGGSRTVEVGAKKDKGILARLWNSFRSIFASSGKPVEKHEVFTIDRNVFNRKRGGSLLDALSENEFKYLRGIIVSRIKASDQSDSVDLDEVKKDFDTLTKEALFSKYGAARHLVDHGSKGLKQGMDASVKQLSENFGKIALTKPGSKETSPLSKYLEDVRCEALDAAKKAPVGEKGKAAQAVFDGALGEFATKLESKIGGVRQALEEKGKAEISSIEDKFIQGIQEEFKKVNDAAVKEQLLGDEKKGVRHGFQEGLNAALASFDQGVVALKVAVCHQVSETIPRMLDAVVAEAERYGQEHGGSDLSAPQKDAIKSKAEVVAEQRIEAVVVDGEKFHVVMDSAEDRKEAYEAGKAIFEPADDSVLDVFSGFFEQAEKDAAKELEAVAKKAEREAEKAVLAVERTEVRATLVDKKNALEVSMLEDSEVSLQDHYKLGFEVSKLKADDKRLELEEVKLRAYDDEKQALVDELENKRKDPTFGNLSTWLDGFFKEREAAVNAQRAHINDAIIEVKKGDGNEGFDELSKLRWEHTISESQSKTLDSMNEKVEILRQQQAVCSQTLKVLAQVREDYTAELQASRYVDPHLDGPAIGSAAFLEQRNDMEVQRMRAALQVDLPELSNADLLEIQSGLTEAFAKNPLSAADVNTIVTLLDKIPVEKAERVLSGILNDVADKEILFATLLTNKAFVTLYQGLREEISRAGELSKDRSIDLNNRKDAEQRLIYFTQVSGKVQALCGVLSGQMGTVASTMQKAVMNLSSREVREKKGFLSTSRETVTVFKPDIAVRGHLTAMGTRARTR